MPFIVLEGLDGAGKSTQVGLIAKMLEERGVKHEFVHFPRFESPVYGELIARFLRGELGEIDRVDPYLVALIYAGDRQNAAPQIRQWLDQGRFVIADRYVMSNVAYQCAKVSGEAERLALRRWILELEYGYNKIPEPDASLFLDVPTAFVESRLAAERSGDDRGYLKGKQDIHEASFDFQLRVRDEYLAFPQGNRYKIVSCVSDSCEMRPAAEIFERIRPYVEALF